TTMAALDENGEPVSVDVEWSADANYLYLGDNVYTWEMPDEETLVLTSENDGSKTTFVVFDGTAEELGATMAVMATN
ncbi:MAG: hypothetical protein IKI37_07925, partial [Oscillospiraceae bacterium]|nr:hypothetical protein [Oscillospiraceae bacterium]